MDEARLWSPLSGVRVVDFAIGETARIGRRLAELGADVIRIEPRDGAEDRRARPSANGVGLAFGLNNLGKRAIGLDLAHPADRTRFEELVAQADILIEPFAPGSQAAGALDVPALRARFPSLLILSITAFGHELEPYVNWQATDPVLQALAGQLSRSGAPGREPLLAPGSLTMNCATDQALFALLLAFFQRSRTGLGDRLDFSLVDGASQALDPGFGIGGSAAGGVRPGDMPPRQGGPQPYPIIRCADGFVRLCVLSVRQWQALYAWMGSPEEFSDPVFDTVAGRFTSPTWQPAIARFFSDKTREVLEAEGQRRGVAVAPLLNFDQAIASEHFAAREAFTTIKLAGSAEAPVPNGVFVIDGRRVPAAGAAPPELNPDGDGFRPRAVAPPSGHEHLSGRPLAGLRVLDLGVIVVGAEQGRLMAEYGAEVIKVESRAFPDGSRQQLEPGVKISLGFATGHRNKKSLGLNLRAPEGRDIFLNLARMSDVILSNFKPGTLDSLGLDAKTLLKANPKLVIADSSAYGSTGPWSGRMGYGPLVRAAAGLTAQWRYRERPEEFLDTTTVYPDHVAARIGIAGVIALLIRRLRTGRGGTVSIAQVEVMLDHMGPQIAARGLEAAGVSIEGPEHDAPWGVFACQGHDQWCVVTIRNNADWSNLCRVIGRDDLASDAALSTPRGRDAQRARIDEAVTAWLRQRPPKQAMELLQDGGVPAGAMLAAPELTGFPPFVSRKAFYLMRQDHLEEPFFVGYRSVRSQTMADPLSASAPLFGEHTRQIARETLDLTGATLERLIEQGVLEVGNV